MPMQFPRSTGYGARSFARDVAVGLIIALVSIPISMGYAMVAGLPAVHGLYGSVLPIFCFSLLTSSPRFVWGVDAAPAALTGGLMASLGIALASDEAVSLIPVVSLCVSLWLLVFFLLKADRILKFVSKPVMGGFITGIGMTIVMMQVPKLFGGGAGTGEIVDLVRNVWSQAKDGFSPLSFSLGAGTVIILLLSRRFFPKVPMQPVLMFLGALLSVTLRLDERGVAMLPGTDGGLRGLNVPDITLLRGVSRDVLLSSFTMAVVILSETLLSTTNIGLRYGDRINTRREILAYCVGNAASAFSGCCPVNGSVSRTGIADQFGVKSQVMGLSAAVFMLLIILFGTGFIRYLPVPVLTGIVISALIGTFEFRLARSLHKADKTEYLIFYAVFFSVLFLGTVYGVAVGVLLSTVTFIIRQAKPFSEFLGVVPGQEGFHSLSGRKGGVYPIKGVVVYRFSGPLFYANIDQFCSGLEKGVTDGTKVVIVDSRGIASVDVTASDRLLMCWRKYRERGIKFYIAGHVALVNEQLRSFGARDLVEEGAVRSRIKFALSAAGIEEPYECEAEYQSSSSGGAESASFSFDLAEFEWAFGNEAERRMDTMAEALALQIENGGAVNIDFIRAHETYWNAVDEDIFLDILEKHLARLEEKDGEREEGRLNAVASLHARIEEQLLRGNEQVLRRLVHERSLRDKAFRTRHPDAYKKIELERERYFAEIAMTHPELARTLARIIAEEEGKKD